MDVYEWDVDRGQNDLVALVVSVLFFVSSYCSFFLMIFFVLPQIDLIFGEGR